MNNAWDGFKSGIWENTINVDDFINLNYTPYDGDESFLAGPTARTTECNDKVKDLLVKERHNGRNTESGCKQDYENQCF